MPKQVEQAGFFDRSRHNGLDIQNPAKKNLLKVAQSLFLHTDIEEDFLNGTRHATLLKKRWYGNHPSTI